VNFDSFATLALDYGGSLQAEVKLVVLPLVCTKEKLLKAFVLLVLHVLLEHSHPGSHGRELVNVLLQSLTTCRQGIRLLCLQLIDIGDYLRDLILVWQEIRRIIFIFEKLCNEVAHEVLRQVCLEASEVALPPFVY
jgi:hypothetical protein